MWKEIFETEGTSIPLAHSNHVLEVIHCTSSIQALYGKVLFIKPLTPREISCAEDIMSRPVKIASIDELMSRKKVRKLKTKEPEVEAPVQQLALSTGTPKGKEKSTDVAAKGGKRKAVELEEDVDNVIVKIPAGSTAISDPSSLNPFIKKLLLEEDEQRLSKIGPIETMKKAAALSYQVSMLNMCL